MSDSARDILERHRRKLLGELVDLTAHGRSVEDELQYRDKAESILATVNDIGSTLSMTRKAEPRMSYVAMKHGIDAVVAYLAEVNRPQTRKQIMEEVVAGGFRGGFANSRPKSRVVSQFVDARVIDASRGRR